MNFMNYVIYEEKVNEIKLAFMEKNMSKIKNLTYFTLLSIIESLLEAYKNRIKYIIFDPSKIMFDEQYVSSEENRKALLRWLKEIISMDNSMNDYEFGKLKIELEEWFFNIGGCDLRFEYQNSYLLNQNEVVEKLGVSIIDLIKRGAEYTINDSKYQIPKHIVYLWQDAVYSLKIQILYNNRKLREQEPLERYQEVKDEIFEFQMKYRAKTSKEAFPVFDENNMDDQDIIEFYEWSALEEEYQLLKLDLIKEYGKDFDETDK